jgi:hypothetical protein
MRRIVFLIVVFLSLPCPLWAAGTTRYVDGTLAASCTSGEYSIANRTCTGSDGNAYKTFQAGLNATLTASDMLYLRAGNYYEDELVTKASGSSGTVITIAKYLSETVNISRITIAHNYNTLSGLHVVTLGLGNTAYAGIVITGSYNTVSGNTIHGVTPMYTTAGAYGMTVSGASNTIFGNTFDGGLCYAGKHTGSNGSATLVDSTKAWSAGELNGTAIRNWDQDANCLSVTNTAATEITCPLAGGVTWNTGDGYVVGNSIYISILNEGDSNTYSGNTFKRICDSERIFDLDKNNGHITGNEFYSIYESHSNAAPHTDLFQVQSAGSGGTTFHGWIIENNYAHDIQGQIGINESPDSDQPKIRNNVFANINQAEMLGGDIYNNTYFNCGGNNASSDHRIIAIGDGNLVKNNVFIAAVTDDTQITGVGIPTSCVTPPVILNNYYGMVDFTARNSATVTGAPVVCSGSKEDVRLGDTMAVNGGDPKFVAPYTDCVNNTCNFHLQSSSPLIGKGVQLNASFTVDKDGVTRGAAWDIGAYEYGGSTPSSATMSGGSWTGRF